MLMALTCPLPPPPPPATLMPAATRHHCAVRRRCMRRGPVPLGHPVPGGKSAFFFPSGNNKFPIWHKKQDSNNAAIP